jgi:hypothetical protein
MAGFDPPRCPRAPSTSQADRLTGRTQEATMTTDEAARLHLYEQARAVLDQSAADTLMNALPRDPDRFATKDDLGGLGTEVRSEMALLRSDLAGFRHEIQAEIISRHNDLLRTLFLGMVASNATLVGLVFAAVRLG